MISGPTTYFKYKNKFRQIGQCLKMGQGKLRVIIYINFVELEYILLHAKFNDDRTISSVKLMTAKAWQRVHVMRKLESRLDRTTLEIIYIAFIRPILEYADIVWCNLTKYEENELEKIQLEATRIVTGTTKLIYLENLYKETGWETLNSRRQQHKLSLFRK